MKYKDLDHAVDLCIKLLKRHRKQSILYFSKSDLESAFRVVPLLVIHRRWLVMMAEDENGKKFYFMTNVCLLGLV